MGLGLRLAFSYGLHASQLNSEKTYRLNVAFSPSELQSLQQFLLRMDISE